MSGKILLSRQSENLEAQEYALTQRLVKVLLITLHSWHYKQQLSWQTEQQRK